MLVGLGGGGGEGGKMENTQLQNGGDDYRKPRSSAPAANCKDLRLACPEISPSQSA